MSVGFQASTLWVSGGIHHPDFCAAIPPQLSLAIEDEADTAPVPTLVEPDQGTKAGKA